MPTGPNGEKRPAAVLGDELDAGEQKALTGSVKGFPPGDETIKFLAGFRIEPSVVSEFDRKRNDIEAVLIPCADLD
jgi:hypothetical protein